jgi:DNA-binding NtrC family response regulator
MSDFEDLLREAAARRTVMVVGPPRPEREDVARRIHSMSNRAPKPLVEVDCTDAADTFRANLSDLLDLADGGTLLLKGLEGLDLVAQRDLMRAVETGQIFLGPSTRDVDVHYLSTVTPALHAEARAAPLRLDLFYKLASMTISVSEPPR